MMFSIIIPTCNRNNFLGLCLERLAPGQQTLDANRYEVIVSDDGKDYPAEAFCWQYYPWVSYIRGPQKGPAANRNNGTKLATGEWFVFTDDDCLPDTGWLQAYSDAILQYPERKAFEGAILPDDWELLKKDMAECPVNTNGGCFWSANIAIERNLFFSINGFDEQFLIAAQEDKDLFNRIKPLTEVLFISICKVIHPVRIVTLSQKLKKLPVSIVNYQKYLQKQSPREAVLLKKNSKKAHLLSIVYSLKQGKFKSAIFHVYALLYYMKEQIKAL